MAILVTGAAGFIGFHLCKRLLDDGNEVIGYDNINNYYDIKLKNSRLEILKKYKLFRFKKADLEDIEALHEVFKSNTITKVVNLAAQAGVRYSLENPRAYIDSNIVGFLNILEVCRKNNIEHLVYASSSSVYGGNTKLPFSTKDNVDHPISLYAATKKSNELMAHTYSHLFNLPTTGLRFFTVYGPFGRPDMALFLFAKAICEGEPIKVYNYGKMVRDFTYVDDIVEGIVRILGRIPQRILSEEEIGDTSRSAIAPYKVYNIGNSSPVELEYYISNLEKCMNKSAIKEYLPLQPGDVPKTYADVSDLERDVNFRPRTSVEEGIQKFVQWFKEYYKC